MDSFNAGVRAGMEKVAGMPRAIVGHLAGEAIGKPQLAGRAAAYATQMQRAKNLGQVNAKRIASGVSAYGPR